MSLLDVAAVCIVESISVSVQATDVGWHEEAEVVVLSRGGCSEVDVELPRGAQLRERSAKVFFGDSVKSKLPQTRWTLEPRGLDDIGVARLHVPELLTGDRVRARFVREFTQPGPYTFAPGDDKALYAELDAPAEGLQFRSEGMERDGKTFWAAEPDRSAVVELVGASVPPPAAAVTEAGLSALDALTKASSLMLLPRGVDGAEPVAGDAAFARGAADDRGFARTVVALSSGGSDTVELRVDGASEVAVWVDGDTEMPLTHPGNADYGTEPRVHRERTEVIDAPNGDVQRVLYPGGGSTVYVTERYTLTSWPASRAMWIPIPTEHRGVEVKVEQPDTPTWWREREDGVVVVAPAFQGALNFSVGWEEPDAPTFGEAPARQAGYRIDHDVVAREGILGWENGDHSWWLKELNNQPVLPGRDELVEALERRFLTVSLPEPAIPLYLKREPRGWTLASELRGALWERAVVAPLPGDPLFPRKLVKARRSRVLTPVEAALTIRLQLLQARMDAVWALVRPAQLGPGGQVSLAGYEDALVRVTWDGEQRWIDPMCNVCGPFEVRPELLYASVIGPGVDEGPRAEGVWIRRDSKSEVKWKLEGPAALELRLWLQGVPADERNRRLAERMGGPGAQLTSHDGLAEAGANIELTSTWGDRDAAEHPLALTANELGEVWYPFKGRLRVNHGGAPGELKTPSFEWTRTQKYEELFVRDRHFSKAELKRLQEARSAKPEPEQKPLRALPETHDEHGPHKPEAPE